ncbi:uncharacterized protein LOC104897694 [Beta vulgaris subsp. vulgaris]|uniref:uncharacterized protein LOC104897694 n=1 Tax=Beta vulgaris subsp. vulgaris TaxID=3555 RepID=UPI00053F9B34|nr:uncharacterized protein LOC104897694 [Beta vulgaris subsp. vulgaris]
MVLELESHSEIEFFSSFLDSIYILKISKESGTNGGSLSKNQQSNTGGISDPYFIATSDNHTAYLVSTVFSGTNFVRWSRNGKRGLIAKNKEGFINGEIVKPDVVSKDYQKWKHVDFMVVSWILSSMSSELADDFGYIESAVDLGRELNERFGQTNGPLVYQLKKEIDNLRQENMTIVSYYGKLKKLWDEMQCLRVFPSCTCGALKNCSCDFLKKVSEFEDEDKMMNFLLRLNSGFDNKVTNVLSMDPLPSINRVFSIAQQIEKQKEVSGVAIEINALAAQVYRNNSRNNVYTQGRRDWRDEKKDKMNKQRAHCKGKGHTIDQCFKIIGYPEWYNAIKAAKEGNNVAVGGKSKPVANVHTEEKYYANDPLDDSTGETSLNTNMLNAICQEVMRGMKGKQSQSGGYVKNSSYSLPNFANIVSYSLNCHMNKFSEECLWIVDSSACDHMIYNESLLINTRKLNIPVKVGLPDGTWKIVEHIGDVNLSDKLVLKDVIPTEQNHISVQFASTGCYFRDLNKSVLLGAGTRKHGLYYFDRHKSVKLTQRQVTGIDTAVCNTVVNDVHNGDKIEDMACVLPNKTATSVAQTKNESRNSLDFISRT